MRAIGADVLPCLAYKGAARTSGWCSIRPEVAEHWRRSKARPSPNDPIARRLRPGRRPSSCSPGSLRPSIPWSRSGVPGRSSPTSGRSAERFLDGAARGRRVYGPEDAEPHASRPFLVNVARQARCRGRGSPGGARLRRLAYDSWYSLGLRPLLPYEDESVRDPALPPTTPPKRWTGRSERLAAPGAVASPGRCKVRSQTARRSSSRTARPEGGRGTRDHHHALPALAWRPHRTLPALPAPPPGRGGGDRARYPAPLADPPRHGARAGRRVLDLYPGTKISIGPPIEDGFYYDFEFPEGVTVSEPTSTRSRPRCASTSRPTRRSCARTSRPAQALERFRAEGQDYKVELIEDLVADKGVETASRSTPTARSPTSAAARTRRRPDRIKAFKLLSVAGAYWRGDADNTMLTRIYGTAFHSKDDLDEHLERLEQARARATTASSAASSGCSVLRAQPRLAVLAARRDRTSRTSSSTCGARERRARLQRGQDAAPLRRRAVADLRATGTSTARTCTSPRSEDQPMGLKPMNCPAHSSRSTATAALLPRPADPLRRAGLVHRHEPSGTLHGLLRVRHFTQDDAHIFCTEEQIEEEVLALPRLRLRMYDQFGFEPRLELSTRPEKRDRHRRDVGPRRGGAAGARSSAAGSSTSSTRATARSTGRRSTST